mmetsp:Transcript_7917/g.17594  ORF Transcript_7917/g.17594 Transcript_7917/m.17594 type:complete len:351 (-) Transcript_7917:339-1391(-)
MEDDLFIFYVLDGFSLGHMQQHMIQLFAWLTELSTWPPDQRPSVLYVMYEIEPPDVLRQIKDKYYDPMIRDYLAYFANIVSSSLKRAVRFPLEVKLVEKTSYVSHAPESCQSIIRVLQESASTPLSSAMTPRRVLNFFGRCINSQQWIGHCASWFPSPSVVRRWRHYLHHHKGLPVQVGPFVQNKQNTWQVLVFDRNQGGSRSLLNPVEVENVTRQVADAMLPNWLAANVTYYRFEGRRGAAMSWDWNCKLFASYDTVVLVHGAAVSNTVCMRQGAGLIEILPQQGNPTKYSMFEPLAAQLKLVRRAVPCAVKQDDFNGIVQPETTALEKALHSVFGAMLRKSHVDRFVV